MGLIKRSNGIYYVRIKRSGILTMFSLRTRNNHLANDLYQAYLVQQLRSNIAPSAFKKVKAAGSRQEKKKDTPYTNQLKHTFESIWNEYFQAKMASKLSKSQLGIKKQVFRHLKEFKLYKVEGINQAFLNQLFISYRSKYTEDTIRKFVAELKCFLNYCIKNDVFSDREYHKLTFPKVITKVRDTLIKRDDIEKILEYLRQNDEDFYTYFLNLLNLYGRPNEIPGLQKKNFNFNEKLCKVYMNKTRKEKTVVLTDQNFINYMRQMTDCLNDDDYILKGHNQGPSYYPNKFRRLKEKLNLNRNYFLYSVRHTVSSLLYEKTKDIKFLTNQLGNEEKILIKHYINTNLEDFKKYLV